MGDGGVAAVLWPLNERVACPPVPAIAVALCCGTTIAACDIATPATCTAGRYYATEFGTAATPMDALQQFLSSSDGADLNANGWEQTQASSAQVTFRSGSDQAIAVVSGDGWVVGPYTTCAT